MLKLLVIALCVATWLMLVIMFAIVICDMDKSGKWEKIFKGDGRDDK